MRHGSSKPRIRFLRSIPLFTACPDGALRRIDALTTQVQASPGTILTKEGQRGREAFVIASGLASVTVGGKEIATLARGELFGEMALLMSPPLRTATVTATTPMELLAMAPQAFASVLRIEGVPAAIIKDLVGRLASTLSRAGSTGSPIESGGRR